MTRDIFVTGGDARGYVVGKKKLNRKHGIVINAMVLQLLFDKREKGRI